MFNKLFTFKIKNCRHLPLNLFNVNIKDKLIFFYNIVNPMSGGKKGHK